MARRKVTDEQILKVMKDLEAVARKLGVDLQEICTSPIVAGKVKKRYGVELHPGNMWRRLTALGWKLRRSPQTFERRVSLLKEKN